MGSQRVRLANRPPVEATFVDRAKGLLPEMESTKQLVHLVSEIYRPGMRVLDVGCNVGHYLRGLRGSLPTSLDYTGVDDIPAYLDEARAIFSNDPAARFELKDIYQPLFPEQPFDIVFCCNVLQDLPDFRRPVANLLESTRSTCLIRMLLGDETTIVKRAVSDLFDENGEPLDFRYQNTWKRDLFVDLVEAQGWKVELIDDEFDPVALENEFGLLREGRGTRVVDGCQANANIIFDWQWIKITRP